MQVEQRHWDAQSDWKFFGERRLLVDAQVVFVFAGVNEVTRSSLLKEVRSMYPTAHLIFGSTAGEILDTVFSENSVVLTAVSFEKTELKFATADVSQSEQSEEMGDVLARQLSPEGLTHVMVFSDGLRVNGTALVEGLRKTLPVGVSVTGGLVGGGNDFKHTYVGFDDKPQEGRAVAIGFYGSSVHIGFGSFGGWDAFGPERLITKSRANVLYELDGKPALELYKTYLGDKAKELPGSGLLFPLNLRIGNDDVVRTLLAINEEEQSLTFAGDMPERARAKLMHANFERLIDGAGSAATLSDAQLGGGRAEFAVLVSCIGRKLVLKERIDEELEAVRSVLGPQAAMVGFYSYGEICPTAASEHQCQLHNQTMTITTFREDL